MRGRPAKTATVLDSCVFPCAQEPEVVVVGEVQLDQTGEDSRGLAPFRAGQQAVVQRAALAAAGVASPPQLIQAIRRLKDP